MSNGLQTGNEAFETFFLKQQTILKLVEQKQRNHDLNMTQIRHIYAICCRLKVDGKVTSSRTVKTIENYVVVNFDVAKLALVVSETANIDDTIK